MSASHDRARAFFEHLLRRPKAWLAIVLLLTGVLGFFGAKVHPDFAIELLFPERDQAKEDYDRYKAIFSYEDARALVMIEAQDIWTPPFLLRMHALEQDLWSMEGVNDVEGPLSIRDVVDGGNETVKIDKLIKTPTMTAEALLERRHVASTDPLFVWQLTPPSATSVTIRVTLMTAHASKDLLRNEFLKKLRLLVKKHEAPGQRIIISGMPVIRSEYTEMIAGDQAITGPLALLVILALLLLTFGSWKEVVAALLTVGISILWTRGAMGILGYPEQILTGLTPVVVMIISISDTVHILVHYREARARGESHHDALVEAATECAIPCLLTEITIAAGFLALYTVNITLISQFGIATAAGMMLTWAANMTVLPLAILWFKPKAPPPVTERTRSERVFARFIAWVEAQVTHRPGRVALCASAIVAVAAGFASRMGTEYFAFDDLRPGSQILQEIRFAERTFGGCNPLAIFVEPGPTAPTQTPMLHPEVIGFLDRCEGKLEELFPNEVKNALSVAAYLKKAHRIIVGREDADARPLPWSSGLVEQELEFIDDGLLLRDYLDFTRSNAAVYVPMPDVGSTRISEIRRELERYIEVEKAHLVSKGVDVKITITGMFAIGEDIYKTLVDGLLWSLSLAVLVSFTVFSGVLGSWRLGMIALIPNLLPLVLTFGFMGATGIDLNPNTVMVFCITLVIADDDTVQFFTRFKIQLERLIEREPNHPTPHFTAAIEVLRLSGLPMFVTACAVALGFSTFLVSNFIGIANVGVLIGVSLFAAVFGDLFVTPILLAKLKPKVVVVTPATGTSGTGAAT